MAACCRLYAAKGTSAVVCKCCEMTSASNIALRNPSLDFSDGLFKTSGYALETIHCLLPQPLHHAGRAVAVRDVVAQRRKTIRLAAFFHFRELLDVELLIGDRAPIVRRVVHGKAWSKSSVGPDDQPVLSGAASPVFTDAPHETFHVLQTRNRIHHFPTLALLVDEPVQKIIDHRTLFRPGVGVAFVKMLEVPLFYHRSFVDVEGDGDPVFVRDGGELFHILNIGAADAGVEENGVPIAILAPYEVVKVRARVLEGFREPRLFFTRNPGEVARSYAAVGKTVS